MKTIQKKGIQILSLALTMAFLTSCNEQGDDITTYTELSATEIAALEAAEDAYDEENIVSARTGDFNLGDWYLSVPVSDGDGPTNLYAANLGDLDDQLSGDLSDFVSINSSETYVNLTCSYTGVKTSSSTDYSRTEFREMWNGNDGDTDDNWGLSGKHTMIVKQRMRSATNKVVIAQIHGKKRNDNTSSEPPMVKIQWESGKIKILYKEGSNTSWSDATKVNVDEAQFKSGATVGTLAINETYRLKVRVSDGKLYYHLKVGTDATGYKFLYDYSNTGWDDYYTNYFKAGNYLQSSSSSDEAEVRVLELTSTHTN